MRWTKVAGWGFVVGLVLLAILVTYKAPKQHVAPAAATPPAIPTAKAVEAGSHPSFLYGRITTADGAAYEGRLRLGGDQEAFWGDYFNGDKKASPWVAQVPPERLPKEHDSIEIFGFKLAQRERLKDLGRRFMARLGDIARIEAHGRDVRVILKSGTVFDLNRFGASDFDDGVRVWDSSRGVVDLDSVRIRTIELLASPRPAAAPDRLHGTVRTGHGEFTGFVQWDRQECLGSDELDGHADDGEHKVRFDTIRSIARRSNESSLVTLRDGRELVLSGTNDVNGDNRGIYVDDPRYGRVLVSWDAFERVDFSPGGSGPAYGDFPPGVPLRGTVHTRDGRDLTGRMAYDLDESETTETLDAPLHGVDYTIPFGLVASIVREGLEGPGPPHNRVVLQGGEELPLEPSGDLGEQNAGMLVLVDGGQRSQYVPWTDVARIDFDRPPAMYPLLHP